MVARLHVVARFLLVLAVIASTQGLLLTQAAFTLRRDYIAERLCVNRGTPEKDCHGRCYLAERLKERQERERQTALLEVALAFVMLRPVAVELPGAVTREPAQYASWTESPAGADPPGDVFHPPRAA